MSDWLELHHINVVGGDATLVVVRGLDGSEVTTKFRALIDSGEEGDGANMLMSYLVELGEIDPGKPDRPDCHGTAKKCYFDLIITTHMHADHIRGFPKLNLAPAWYIDTTAVIKDVLPTYADIGATKGNARDSANYLGFMNQVVNSGTTQRIPLHFTNMSQTTETMAVDLIPLITSIPAVPLRMHVVCANGVMAGLPKVDEGTATARMDLFAQSVNDKNKTLGKKGAERASQTYLDNTSPNDFSIGTFIAWNDFRYFTSGDLSGDSDGNEAGNPSYKDLESFVVANLKTAGWIRPGDASVPGIDAVKIAHHGSAHSTFVVRGPNGASFLGDVRPRAMIVPTNQKKWVPGLSYLKRAAKYVIDQRSAAKSQETVAGLLMANQTEFWKGNPDYDVMNSVRVLSTCGTNPLPTDFHGIPFNLVEKSVTVANGREAEDMDNNPTEAIVILAGADLSGVPALSTQKFGDTLHSFSNFKISVRTSGPDLAKTIVLKQRSFEVINLNYKIFNLKVSLTDAVMQQKCREMFAKAASKNTASGSGEEGESYMLTYLPTLHEIYIQSSTADEFCGPAAVRAAANLDDCYSTNAQRTQFRLVANYKDNSLGVLRTVESLVQTYLSDITGLVEPDTQIKLKATRSRLKRVREGTVVTDNRATKAQKTTEKRA